MKFLINFNNLFIFDHNRADPEKVKIIESCSKPYDPHEN